MKNRKKGKRRGRLLCLGDLAPYIPTRRYLKRGSGLADETKEPRLVQICNLHYMAYVIRYTVPYIHLVHYARQHRRPQLKMSAAPAFAESEHKDEPLKSSEDAPANAANVSSARKEPPPEKPEQIRMRSFVLLSFWAIIILLGLPIWWRTTTIYRADLPLDQMMDWADGRACLHAELLNSC
jgi:hypothetical protein